MKAFLLLTIALALCAVALSDDHKKKKTDRHHHEKKHHGDRSHGKKEHRNHHHAKKGGRAHDAGGHGKHERAHEEVHHAESNDRHRPFIPIDIWPYCTRTQIRVCGGYNCPDLTCSNYDQEIDNWVRCLFGTDNNFTNMIWCLRVNGASSLKCICNIGLVWDESTETCVKKSECGGPVTTGTPPVSATTVTNGPGVDSTTREVATDGATPVQAI